MADVRRLSADIAQAIPRTATLVPCPSCGGCVLVRSYIHATKTTDPHYVELVPAQEPISGRDHHCGPSPGGVP